MSARQAVVRVLVADDHPIVREGIVSLISTDGGIEVVGSVGDGLRAVELSAELKPDVVVMDLRMPGMDGVAATAAILASDPHVRVLVLTTFDTDAQIVAAVAAGARGYVLKAAPPQEVLAAVRAVAAGGMVLSPQMMSHVVRHAQGRAVALSPRERDVLSLVAQGKSNAQIGRQLHIGESTVKTHLVHVFEKLEVADRTRAVTRAMELGLL